MSDKKALKDLSKEELEALAAERGLKVAEGANKKELLKALEAEEKKGADSGKGSDATDEDEEEEEKGEASLEIADCVRDGVYIRSFSRAIHGEAWKKNLEEFVQSTNQETAKHNANPKRVGGARPMIEILEGKNLVKALKVTFQVRNTTTKAWEDKTEVLSGAGFRERALALGVEKATSVFVA